MANSLFSRAELSTYLRGLQEKLRQEVQTQDPDYVLNVSVTDLTSYFVERFSLDVPELDQQAIYVVSQGDARIDVSGDRSRHFSSPGPHYLDGTRVTIGVPFSGDPDLFDYRPSRRYMVDLRAEVRPSELHLVYTGLNQTADQIKASYERDVELVSNTLAWMRDDVDPYVDQLETTAQRLIDERRTKVLRDRDVVENLGLPIQPRPGEAKTYSVPDVRRKPRVTAAPKPTATREPYRPELVLEDSTYEEILGIVRNMAHVMERSPSAFQSMGEEDLRQHFLVQLNGQFEGDATAETFNFDGKTDILIRRDGRNVFIAECKYWEGPRTVVKTIDQILGYLSWRDTKTAVLLFVRNKNFSAVVDQIIPLVEAHPGHKKSMPSSSETEFRFVFGQREDENRELRLAVLLFPVPASPEG